MLALRMNRYFHSKGRIGRYSSLCAANAAAHYGLVVKCFFESFWEIECANFSLSSFLFCWQNSVNASYPSFIKSKALTPAAAADGKRFLLFVFYTIA